MRVDQITFEEALEICERMESHFFDRKDARLRPAGLEKTVVAFANADGGEVFVGVKDDKEETNTIDRWRGLSDIEDYNAHIASLSTLNPTVPFRIKFLQALDVSTNIIMSVNVDKSNFVHKTSSQEVYVRQSAQSIRLTDPQRIIALSYSKGATTFEDELLMDCPPEVVAESAAVKDMLYDVGSSLDGLDYLLNQNLLRREDFAPKVASVLLYADDPSSFMPRQCAVKVIRYETQEDDPERDHLKEVYTVEGSSYDLIRRVIDKITEILSGIKIWTTYGLKPVEYPQEAIWEIVVNAIIHRDYSISDHVHVKIFNDRIEVISPGKLPGFVSVDNILDQRFSRNPRVVRQLARYKNPPNKDMGEGLDTAFQKMKEWKLKNPVIEELENGVRVTIPHTPLATPEQAILEFLENNESIKNSQARDLTGIRSENAVKNVFYRLRDAGKIERVPGLAGASSAWRKIERQ
ncbi:DNA-binding protein [Deinococcus aetherius]|uniref:DNA-binding protein n=1 Tax=Deinococcus aetherius TaxID=200252 RepID=A0ABM8AHK0_9DEIO|nr:DNA-binding protein [Deinococcus aetherius]